MAFAMPLRLALSIAGALLPHLFQGIPGGGLLGLFFAVAAPLTGRSSVDQHLKDKELVVIRAALPYQAI